jgi:hypothetical protein
MATQGAGSSNQRTGIVIGITANSGESVSLERDTSGAFGSAVVLYEQDGGLTDYYDPIALDGVTYYYRARVSQTGAVTSGYSGTVSAKPTYVNYLA